MGNSLERLGRMDEFKQQQQQQADQKAAHAAAYRRVNTALHHARRIDTAALDANKKPTIALMKGFVEQYPQSVVPAWRLYLQKHGVGSGSTIAWKYYFDFVWGGYTYHPTLKEDNPLPLVLDDQKGQADAASAPPPEAWQGPSQPAGAAEQPIPI